MRVEKIEIKSFSRLKNLNLNFSKGMNIVYGRNESGKTSVQTFIKGMLYGLKSGRPSKEGLLPPLKRHKPWDSSEYSGFMEFQLDSGDSYRVERDFNASSVKIYDGSYNDITGSFDMTKDRGPQYAEKFLGLNETCFEKTAFIKQMETKIDEDAGKELLNRLLNVSQTGFEDISLIKAQEALKEAQKNYIGTDKTSTRPLDRIISRQEELKHLKSKCIEKRTASYDIERSLNEEYETRKKLEDRKALLGIAKSIFEIKREADSINNENNELNELQSTIQNTEQERKTVLKRILEINTVRKQLGKFADYNEEDLDSLNIWYHSVANAEKEDNRLRQEREKRIQNAAAYISRLEELKAFQTLEEEAEKKLLNMSKELEHLRLEKEKNNMEALEERIRAARNKDKSAGFKAALSVILLACAALLWFIKPFIAFMGIPVFLGLSILTVVSKSKSSKELKDLLNIKKVAFVFSSGVLEEIEKKQREIGDILKRAGVEGIEEFLKQKAEYDSASRLLNEADKNIKELETQIAENSIKQDEIRANLVQMLLSVGIIKTDTDEILEEHIIEFKNGVRRFCGLEPSLKYVMQRVEDLDGILVGAYLKASGICHTDCRDIADTKEFIETLSMKLKSLEERLSLELDKFSKECSEKKVSVKGLEDLKNRIPNMDINELENVINFNYNYCFDELNNAQLRIKEYETLLKGLDTNDDELQKFDKEFEELEVRKNELGDLSICLKTALDLLNEAGAEIQKDFAPALNKRMSGIISKITSDRYKDLRADDRLTLKAVTAETGDVVIAGALSGGTVDQVYLSLRLAMAELISSGGESLPVIMDEIFAQYDDIRTKETMEYFKELSDSRQLMLFTCKSRELAIAQEVFGDSVNIIELV